MLGHADGLGGDEGARTLVSGTERYDDVLVAGYQDAQLAVSRKRGRDALEHDLGPLVPSHGVDADGCHFSSSLGGSAARHEKETDPRRDRPPRPRSL